jgi:hypothetical protein
VKNFWDYGRIRAYEAQTNAIRSEIFTCMEKAKELGTELVFVTNSKRTKEEIERITENKYDYVKIQMYPEFKVKV